MIIVTKEFTFDSAHYLEDYQGPCANVHGHTYKLQVSVSGPLDGHGMVTDFSQLKTLVQSRVLSKFDHKMINAQVAYNPTAENMVLDISRILREALPDRVKLMQVRLWETPTSFATWRGE